jgi:glycosyltransferase involved in cell wall biosynthesis
MSRPVILHSAASYPAPGSPDTRASSLLLSLVPEFTHHVYVFKRTGWKPGQSVTKFDDDAGTDHRFISYGAPPKGVLLARFLDQLATWIIKDVEARGIVPDLVHAHKITIDALVGQRLADHFNVPLILTIQSNTDEKIVRFKRSLKGRFDRIWQQADAIFAFAPNARDAIISHLGAPKAQVAFLPCPTEADALQSPLPRAKAAKPTIVTAFNIAHFKNKNVKNLFQALAEASKAVPDIQLKIIGGGDDAAAATVQQMADQIAPGRVSLLGAQPLEKMQGLLRDASAFALLSKRESYGMVFAESLLAGTPILYPSNRAIDGYFEDGEFSLSADPNDVDTITKALIRLCNDESGFKSRLAAAQENGSLDFMCRPHIAQQYRSAVTQVLAAAQTAAPIAETGS